MPTANPDRPTPGFPWSSRWADLARTVDLPVAEPVVVALSGGADSVFLLHLAARAQPGPERILAVHVEHGLRGEESRAEAEFCAELCEELGIPLERRSAPLAPDQPDLEARARELRYAALVDAARGAEIGTILTGHHRDDQLETLLMRWLRGSELAGMPGLRSTSERRPASQNPGSARQAHFHEGASPIMVARPLIDLRRTEIRQLLVDQGISWREDSSNRSERFTRNRVRHQLLPMLAEGLGDPEEAIENLLRFAEAVHGLEEELAAQTAHVAWRRPAWLTACRSERDAHLGGTLARSELERLPSALQRRTLWRLLREGTGRAPGAALVEELLQDLNSGARSRHELPGSFRLLLRGDSLHLVPPAPRALQYPHQADLPFPAFRKAEEEDVLRLGLPGLAPLPDGRAIQAEIVSVAGAKDVPRRPDEVELDPGEGPGEVRELTVRWARPGDRFHGLGAPGSRPLGRFLADAGIPREERGRVPLVFADGELIWVAGLRPSERRRIRAGQARRLRLRLLGAALEAPRTGKKSTGSQPDLFDDAG